VKDSPKLALLVCLSLGCFPGKVGSDASTTGDTTSEGGESASSELSTEGDGDPIETSTDETEEEEEEGGFVIETDYSTCSVCDELAQDCPEGEKCTPGVFVAACGPPSCKPIIGDVPPGDTCTIVDDTDDCDASSWCYPGQLGIDGPSECIEFCQGSIDDSFCTNPEQVCAHDKLLYEGALGCRPRCDPRMPDGCGPTEMCTISVNYQADFACVPDGAELAVGEPCSANQQCIGGLCVSAPDLPECADDRCCASFCDLLAPDCPDATECVAIELSDNPESTVGVCRLPD
jgi:hypothetical protein